MAPSDRKIEVEDLPYAGVGSALELLETQKAWILRQKEAELEDIVRFKRTLSAKEEKIEALEQAVAEINVALAVLNTHA